MRILGIDPGKKNIGVSLSDPTGTLASPLSIIRHKSREDDAILITTLAQENNVELIIVGQALDPNGMPTLSGRNAKRLAAAIRQQSGIPVILWDESNSTLDARALATKSRRGRKPNNHIDDIAAVVILQSYLDMHSNEKFLEK